jgi:hypothetical protein
MTGTLMKGFPPAPADQASLANWRTAPFNRWSFHHVREIIPSADIPHDPRRVRPLPLALVDADGLRIPGAAGRSLSLDDFLADASTDGLVVLHRGRIVIERYANGMTEQTPHILMSVSKSLLGILAGILIGEGAFSPEQQATSILPELTGTAFDGATIRQLLDMRVGLAFDEDYLATSGPIVEYRKATNWNPLEPSDRPSDLRSFFQLLRARDGDHGGRFHYVSPNTDLLGWIIERATGRRYADLMSSHLWQPAGAQQSAYITVDRTGAPRCAGGICVTTRDLARIGQVIADDGDCEGKQVIPAGWIDDIANNGSTDAWNAGAFTHLFPGQRMHYRSKWYVGLGKSPLLFALGIHGQYLFVDRRHQLVIALMSSQANPIDEQLISLTMAAVSRIRDSFAAV